MIVLSNFTVTNTYENFMQVFKKKSGLDLTAYKQNQMERRIRSFMTTYKYETFSDFFKALDQDPSLYDKFFKHLTINVSQFFRDPNQWKMFRELIIPQALSGKRTLKIWSAGCSSGQEPYTFAITLLEYFPGIRFNILASDIDENVLKQASEGLYKQSDFVTTSPELLAKYFTATPHGYNINDSVKQCVKFKKQNLLTDVFDTGFDLIACRNVVIYFTEDTKEMLYRKFYAALGTGGVLFTGSTEHLFGMGDLGLKSVSSFFYQKT